MASDTALLIRDKYDGNATADLGKDLERLAAGEPLAYVIGWIPFLDLCIYLGSKPLIPRPETEWWTEVLIKHLQARFGSAPLNVLDLCAGSGAIGLAILKHLPQATVTFIELDEQHLPLIHKNLLKNDINPARANVLSGNLFAPLSRVDDSFDIIATNPPYVPNDRTLDSSVTDFEPAQALFAGTDGLTVIQRIATETPLYLRADGELWLECDTGHATVAASLVTRGGAEGVEIRTDLYGRPRLIVGYYV